MALETIIITATRSGTPSTLTVNQGPKGATIIITATRSGTPSTLTINQGPKGATIIITATRSGTPSTLTINRGPQGPPGPLQWIDYTSHWDTAPTEVSAGVLSYTWLGVTRYRNVPDPYVASSDAFYSDAGLTNLIIARGQ